MLPLTVVSPVPTADAVQDERAADEVSAPGVAVAGRDGQRARAALRERGRRPRDAVQSRETEVVRVAGDQHARRGHVPRTDDYGHRIACGGRGVVVELDIVPGDVVGRSVVGVEIPILGALRRSGPVWSPRPVQ